MDGSTFGHHWSTAGPIRCLLKFVFIFWVCISQAWGEDFRRDLLLEFEPVDGASAYEIEVVRDGKKTSKPQVLRFATATWKGKLRPGLYRVRLRSLDERGVAGDWSEAMELKVAHPPMPPITPSAREELRSEASEIDVEVRFEERSVDGFEAKIFKGDTFLRSELRDEGASRLRLQAGEEYRLELTPYRSDGGPVEPTSHQILVLGPKLEPPEFLLPADENIEERELVWKKATLADQTRLDLTSRETKRTMTTTIAGHRLSVAKLADGVYSLKGTSIGTKRIASASATWFMQIREGRIFAQGESLEDLNRAKVKPRWSAGAHIGLLSERFDGSNAELGTRTRFGDSEGPTVQAEAETPSLWKNISVWGRSRFSNVTYAGGQGPDFDVQLISAAVDGRFRWKQSFVGEGSYFASVGTGYEEVPEFVTARERPIFGAQFVQQIPVRFGFGIETRWRNKVSARAALTLVGGMIPIAVPRDGTLGERNGGGDLELGLGYQGFSNGVFELRLEGSGREIEYRSGGFTNTLKYDATRILVGAGWEF